MLEEKLKGLRAELVDDEFVTVYSFSNSSNHLSAVIGIKDGPLAGPLYNYKVINESSILIDDGSSSPIKWESIEFAPNLLTVTCNGKKTTYQTNNNS